VSRIHGTRGIREVTGGHEEDPIREQEEPRGHHRTRKDTPLRRFGTVRPRVQIPGPRPFLYSKSAIFESLGSHLHSAVSQFPEEQPNRGAVNGFVVGNVRSPDSNRWPAGGRTGQDREAPRLQWTGKLLALMIGCRKR